MRVTVSGRHMSVGDDLRHHCIGKAERLARFFDRIQSIEIIIDGHDGEHCAEIIVHSDGSSPFVASQEAENAFASVDLLMDKIENQIRRHKERLRNRKHPPRATEQG